MIFGNRAFTGLVTACILACSAGVALAAVEGGAISRDILVYKDGDRIHGAVVQRTSEEIVFKSDRFGELRVRAADAVVIPAEEPVETKPKVAAQPAPAVGPIAASQPVPSPAAQQKQAEEVAQAAAERAEVEKLTIWDRFTPSVMTAKVREFFGPWKGRFAFSTEVVTDTAERNNISLEGRLTRKWERNELQLSARYDFVDTNDITTTDTVKTTGSWRHEFNKKWFAHYRPSAEMNRASRRQGVPNEYVLLQQEIGAGYHVYTTPSRKLRAGVSQNLFDIWNTAPTPDHTSRGVQSFFEEIELKLPWQMGLTQRGMWYPVRGEVDGWENRFELNKKLTETLSTSVRHEIRRNNPDGSAQDYTRLKLMFGLDF